MLVKFTEGVKLNFGIISKFPIPDFQKLRSVTLLGTECEVQ